MTQYLILVLYGSYNGGNINSQAHSVISISIQLGRHEFQEILTLSKLLFAKVKLAIECLTFQKDVVNYF